MANDFQLEPVTAIAVATVGPPGQRQFFLQAQGDGRTVTLACEKAHIQVLVMRIAQLLQAQGLADQAVVHTPAAIPPMDPMWTVAELGFGFHEGRNMFVIVAREAAPAEQATTIRFWLGVDQVYAFAHQAQTLLASGRRLCQRCGLPIDSAGHPCPAANGSRPVF